MSINVADNFSYQGSKPLDARFQFSTVANMKAYAEASLYNGCLAYITGTKEYYTYDSSNSVDATTGRWRIFESGGSSTLTDLTDTTISSPSNGQVLAYDSATSKWKNSNASGGASSLNELSDVTISSASNGQVLKHNGTSWVNGDVPSDNTKQPRTLVTPLVIDGENITTVENALDALNNKTASGAVSTELLDFKLEGNITSRVGVNKTKFYTWSHSGANTTITNLKLPELDTTVSPFGFYNAFIIINTSSTTGGNITVIYNYIIDDNYPQSSAVNHAEFSRIAIKNLSYNNGSISVNSDWKYNNTDVTSDGYFNFAESSFNPQTYAIKGKTTFFTGRLFGTALSGNVPFLPANGVRYTYFISYPESDMVKNIYLLCIVYNGDDVNVTSMRMFTGIYNYSDIYGTAGMSAWKEIGESSVDTTKLYSTDDTAETALADADYVPFYDTSATAKRKTLWSNIKSVLKTYFDTVYSGIFTNATELAKIGEQNGVPTYDGQIISLPTVHNFDKANLYSTTEQVVGKWSDGRPLYQMTFSGTSSSSSGVSVTLGSISSYNRIIKCFGSINLGNNLWAEIPYTQDGTTGLCLPYVNGNSVQVQAKESLYLSKPVIVTVQYTKSTDAANSFNYASENDYSTSETIVGTWVDGKTLYQRTYSKTLTSGTNDTVGTLPSTAKPKHVSAFIVYNSAGSIEVIPKYDDATNNAKVYTNGTSVVCSHSSNYNTMTCWVTVQYTKS